MRGKQKPVERTEARADGTGRRFVRPRVAAIVLVALAVIVVAVLAILTASKLALDGASARRDIETRLETLIGRPVSIGGTSTFSLLPRTVLTLNHVRIGSGKDVMTVDRLRAELDLTEALRGRTQLEELTLTRPETSSILTFLGTVPQVPPEGEEATLSQLTNFLLNHLLDLRTLVIRDGVFGLGDGSRATGISNVNVVASWPRRNEAARVSASYVWNGQPAKLDVSIAAPASLLVGEPTNLSYDLSAPPLAVTFRGQGSFAAISTLQGTFSLDAPSFVRAARWIGDPAAPLPDIGALTLKGQLSAFGSRLSLQNASVGIGGNEGKGALEMTLAEKGLPLVSGTLAFEHFTLNSLQRAIIPLPTSPVDFERPITLDFVRRVDLDLRLSASSADLGSIPLNDFAAAIKMKDGVAILDIGDASLLGGRGQASVMINATQHAPTASGEISLEDIDLSALSSTVGFSTLGVSGTGRISASFSSPANNWGAILRHAKARAKLSASDGSINGVDSSIFLSPGEHPFAASANQSIPYSSLSAELSAEGPDIELQSLTMKTGQRNVQAAGVLASSGSVDVAGLILPTAEAEAPAPEPMRFALSGDWVDPRIESEPLEEALAPADR
ncbi:Uncharacterized protein involved in outer membrane biogenesis [Consotaella salsifontis]|uniref:Uncharacterized protein involved in outer membrane biogenesis n=1 Tax=Consotaella salsifontis TaxID=1365950 RepID=A0A1T4Q2D9_9HYPH|nr:Uncharacterized protein involved in outer membrane biogenesis [Consotaella salsifontis]